jgi:hypothetical protein
LFPFYHYLFAFVSIQRGLSPGRESFGGRRREGSGVLGVGAGNNSLQFNIREGLFWRGGKVKNTPFVEETGVERAFGTGAGDEGRGYLELPSHFLLPSRKSVEALSEKESHDGRTLGIGEEDLPTGDPSPRKEIRGGKVEAIEDVLLEFEVRDSWGKA